MLVAGFTGRAQGSSLPCGKGAGKGSACLSDKSWSVYLNPQCFFICLFKSFPAKKEQKEGGKLPLWATPPRRDGPGALQGPEHPACPRQGEGICLWRGHVPIFGANTWPLEGKMHVTDSSEPTSCPRAGMKNLSSLLTLLCLQMLFSAFLSSLPSPL